jgi:hypothetical protein
MPLQVDSAISSLTKLTILSSYIGASSLKFNRLNNQFEKSSKSVAIIRFTWSCLLNALYFNHTYRTFNFRISTMFVYNMSGFFYGFMSAFLSLSITICNKNYEDLTIVVLNKLHRFRFPLEKFPRRSVKEIVVLGIMFCDTFFRLITLFLFAYMQAALVNKPSNKFVYLEVAVTFVNMSYAALVKILSEGRLLLSYIIITKCCTDCIHTFDKHSIKTLIRYQHLLESTENINKIFSGLFLMYIGFYFSCVMMWVMGIFCSIHDQTGKVFSIFEIVGVVLTFFKIVVIILIPNESMMKVVGCDENVKKIDRTNFRSAK